MPRQPIPPIEALIEQLHGTDWTARCYAAPLLGLEDTDWRVQQAIVTLERIRSPQALPALLEIVLQSEHERSASCSWMPGM